MQLQRLKTYILEDEFRVTVLNGRVNIVNYKEMGHFDSNKVIVRYEVDKFSHNLIIKGKNLVVAKLKKCEVLIVGVIDNIEFR